MWNSIESSVEFLLFIADMVHKHHLEACGSYAEHTLTDELYTCIRDGADKIAEQALALGFYETEVEALVYTPPDWDNMLEMTELVATILTGMRSAVELPVFQSLIDDVTKELASIIYKLQIEYGAFLNQGIIAQRKVRKVNVLSKIEYKVKPIPKIKPPRLDIRNRTRHDTLPKLPKPKLEKPKSPFGEN